MRNFNILRNKINEKIKKMSDENSTLFLVDLDREKLWNIYLNFFSEEEKEYLNCRSCKHFFENVGNIIALNNNLEYETIFNIEIGDEFLDKVVLELSKEVRKYPISNIFKTEMRMFGSEDNLDKISKIKYEHFVFEVPYKYRSLKNYYKKNSYEYYIKTSAQKKMILRTLENKRKNLLKILENNELDSLEILKYLIDKMIYENNEYSKILKEVIKLKKQFDTTSDEKKSNFIWSILENIEISKKEKNINWLINFKENDIVIKKLKILLKK